MTIELKPTSEVHSVIFAGTDGMDFLCCIYRNPDEGWQARYRFRYHRDAKVHDSADEKSWYTIQLRPGHEPGNLLDSMRKLREGCPPPGGWDTWEELPIHGGPEKLTAALKMQSWCSTTYEEVARG